jgi:hypothetical protein
LVVTVVVFVVVSEALWLLPQPASETRTAPSAAPRKSRIENGELIIGSA